MVFDQSFDFMGQRFICAAFTFDVRVSRLAIEFYRRIKDATYLCPPFWFQLACLTKLLIEPCTRKIPVAHHGIFRDLQNRCDLAVVQTSEIS